ncbi:MAG: hypothetical protein ACTHYS_06290 [Ancrocorticia populi]|uniref:hypothetical protein n=1 Tax=Ancrocorticia populi TaxID=2175228 RepID=UPI003F8E04D6
MDAESDYVTTESKEAGGGDEGGESVVVENKPKEKKRKGGGLFRYILIRFLLIFPTIFILVTLVFFLMRATGDPITAALGGRLTPSQLQERIAEAGYDRPLIVQYGDYLWACCTEISARLSRITARCWTF